MRERLRDTGWMALLVCVVIGFFHKTVFEGHSLVPTDLLHQLILPYNTGTTAIAIHNHYAMDALTIDYPWAVFWQQRVRAGELPLWNPFILGGHPHLAESMPAVLAPWKLPLLVLPAERGFSLGIVLQFVAGALFMFAFLRELGRSRPAAFLGGCAFSLNSAFVMWYWRAPSAFVWVPLVLFLVERGLNRQSWAWTTAAGLALGVAFLSGSIQAAAHVGLLCAVYFAARLPWRDPVRRPIMLRQAAVVLGLGCLVAAIQWLPAFELLAQDASTRADRGGRPGLRHTLVGMPALITFVFPALAGSTESYDLLKLAGASMGDFTGYIGVIPVTLAIIAARQYRDRYVRAMLWLIAVVVFLIFFTPLVRFLYHRFFVVAVFGLATLAAAGFDQVLSPSATGRRTAQRVLTGMAALAILVAVGLLVVQVVVARQRGTLVPAAERFVMARAQTAAFGENEQWLRQRVQAFFTHYRLANPVFAAPIAALLLATAGWRAFASGRLGRQPFIGGVLLLVVADLWIIGQSWLPQVDLQKYPLPTADELLSPLQADHSLFRVGRFGARQDAIYRPNWLLAYGVQDLWGNMSLAPRNMDSLPSRSAREMNGLLDLQNVKYVFTLDSVDLPTNRFTRLVESRGLRLYRNEHCLPRAFFVPAAQSPPDPAGTLQALTAPDFNPRRVVLLPAGVAPRASATNEPPVAATVTIVAYRPRSVVLNAHCPAAGFVVLSDTYYSGWQALIDGQAVPLYRANLVMRAVPVTAGEHRIEFRYRPGSYRLGAAITLSALAGALLLIGRSATRTRRPRSPLRSTPAAADSADTIPR